MRVRLISKEGSFCSIAYRMEQSGADCLTYISDEECKHIGDNLLLKVKTPIELDIQSNDLVLFDASGAGEAADTLKKRGIQVVGAGEINDKLELDRSFGIQFMRGHGIPVPESYEFDDIDETIAFIEKHPDRYVFKPHGNPGLSLTYVSTSPENMKGMLPYLKREADKKGPCRFVLQKVIDGVEMSTEGWFNGREFLLPLNSTFEEKRFMEDSKGPQTGCMGSVMWHWSLDASRKLYELLFRPMEDSLREAHYLGPLDINAIWTPNGPYGLEFTPRFGFDAVQGFLRTLDERPQDFLSKLPELSAVPARDGQIAMAVAVSTSPYPAENVEDIPHVPIQGITPQDLRDTVYTYDVMLDQEIGMLSTSGAYNWVCSVTDSDTDFLRLRRRVYSVVDRIEVADKQFRSDIGDRFAGDLKRVSQWIARL